MNTCPPDPWSLQPEDPARGQGPGARGSGGGSSQRTQPGARGQGPEGQAEEPARGQGPEGQAEEPPRGRAVTRGSGGGTSQGPCSDQRVRRGLTCEVSGLLQVLSLSMDSCRDRTAALQLRAKGSIF